METSVTDVRNTGYRYGGNDGNFLMKLILKSYWMIVGLRILNSKKQKKS
jgi:hypothetical protein